MAPRESNCVSRKKGNGKWKMENPRKMRQKSENKANEFWPRAVRTTRRTNCNCRVVVERSTLKNFDQKPPETVTETETETQTDTDTETLGTHSNSTDPANKHTHTLAGSSSSRHRLLNILVDIFKKFMILKAFRPHLIKRLKALQCHCQDEPIEILKLLKESGDFLLLSFIF